MSENIRWGMRKSFADGKVRFAYSAFLGYEKGEDGLPKIVEKEAEIIRRIYYDFLDGKTPFDIAKRLTNDGIPTPTGCKQWGSHTVKRILQNEKYKGSGINTKIETLTCELDVISELTRKLVDDNACNSIDQNEYITKYESYVKRYESAKTKLEKLQNKKYQRLLKRDAIGAFMFALIEHDEVITQFDERLFNTVVERVVVRGNGMEVEFKIK